MSSVEAAASLFGSEDSSQDPFASLGTELETGPQDDFFAAVSSDRPEAQNQSQAAGHRTEHASYASPPASNSYSGQDGTQSHFSDQPTWSSSVAGGHSQPTETNAYSAPNGYFSYEPAVAEQQPTHKTYVPTKQQSTSDSQSYGGYSPYTPQSTANSYGNHTAQHNPASYDSYASSMNTSNYNSYASQAAAPAVNAYAPPSAPSSHSPYVPAQAQNGHANAYAPPTPSYRSSSFTNAPADPYTSATPQTQTSSLGPVPEPPKLVAPLNRPKPNAYDPPFPTGSSRRSQRNVTPYETAAYKPQAQSQPTLPLPPPPPAPPSRNVYSSPVQNLAMSPSQQYSVSSYGQQSDFALSNSTAGYTSPPPSNHVPPSRGSSFDAYHPEGGQPSVQVAASSKVPAYSRPTSRAAHDRYTPSPLGTSRVITSGPPNHILPEEHSAPPAQQQHDPEAHEALGGSMPSLTREQSAEGSRNDPLALSDVLGDSNEQLLTGVDNELTVDANTTLTTVVPDIFQTSPTVPSLAHSSSILPGSRSSSPHVSTDRYMPGVGRVSSPMSNSSPHDYTPASPSEPLMSNTYGPPPNRALSPAMSTKSNGSHSAYKSSNYAHQNTRNRSTSNGSVISSYSSSSINDAYAPPSKQVRRQASEMSDYGEYSTSRYNYPVAPPPGQSPYAPPISSSQSTMSSYAPSAPAGSANPYTPSSGPSGSNLYAPATDPSHPPQTQYGRSEGDVYSSRQPQTQPASSYPAAPYSMDLSPYAIPNTTYDTGPSQELTVPSVMSTQYAPSPSLLASNDPLGRTAARIPVFNFGFGGKCVTCFHGASTLETGFDVALTSRRSTVIEIKQLNKVVEESALSESTAVFPGPLFSDPGTPTSLVRTGLSTQTSITKAKKAKVLKYLNEREAEISSGIPYLHSETVEHGKAEGKLALVKLLVALVEHDGQLTGVAQGDSVVREILVPRLKVDKTDDGNGGGSFTSVADIQGLAPDFGYSNSMSNTEDILSTTVLHASSLDKIQNFLLQGERRQAYHYALDQKLWAHAMVISSSIDKEAWKEAVSEFLKTELAPKDASHLHNGSQQAPSVTGREGLRVAYSLYSGNGAAAVQELVPQTLLSKGLAAGMQPIMSTTTPGTPNFPSKSTSASIPLATLSKWAETAAMMYSNPMGSEASAALTSLGDHLSSNGWLEAAHTCYLLSPQSSPIGGVGSPATRICLVGGANPTTNSAFHLDQDSIIFTEILEYAFSLNTSKSHEPFVGLPHLQPYRLLRAVSLAEIGQVQQAKRYCEAISSSLGRSSPYFTSAFLDQLKFFMDRIVAAPQLDKSGSWIPGKVSKPSLDTIGGWLEGRITKLIAGDGEPSADGGDETARPERGSEGPFKHYSTISSNAPSTSPSPAPSLSDTPAAQPPRRNGPATPYAPHLHSIPPPTGRSASAMDFNTRKASPGPRVVSAGPGTTTFSQSGSFSQAMENMHRSNQYSPIQEAYTPTASSGSTEQGDDGTGQEVSWWGQSSYADTSFQTPTATTFMKVENPGVVADSDGFISLMDNTPSFTPSPSQLSFRAPTHQSQEPEDEDDLGFGNSKSKPKADAAQNSQSTGTPKTEPPKPAERPDAKPNPNAGSSWFGRWWKKEGGPVRANLGEERSIYYDPEQKRWVNKNAATDAQKPAVPPPPPSRVQTASPGANNAANRSTPPPPRASSAVDLGSSPPTHKTVMRVRSNLVPAPESAPSTPTGLNTSLAPPSSPKGPDRPRSQASKRNIRSRYVDVFQEGQ